jgi:hypothetical protein
MIDEITTSIPDQRQKTCFRFLGKRRKDKAKLVLVISICYAVSVVFISWVIG